MSTIYLDNAATTQILPTVLEEMLPYLKDNYGNPSSNHHLGLKARKAKEAAREKVASLINAKPEEIFFTSGATEANNWVLHAIDREYYGTGNIMVSNVEHSSILRSVEKISRDRYMIVPVAGTGEVTPQSLSRRLDNTRDKIDIVSIMMANNETGIINDIKRLVDIAKQKHIPFHTDATQALGHVCIDVKDLGVDALSASAHKIYGPKGAGFLYVNKKGSLWDLINSHPLISGGHQENGLRAGTENMAAIVGLGEACEDTMEFLKRKNSETMLRKMADDLRMVLQDRAGAISNAEKNVKHIPIINMRIPEVENHHLLQLLDECGVCISAGSACNEGSNSPSHVLTAMGLKDWEIKESIRISVGRNNTEAEIKAAGEIIVDKIKTLRMFSDRGVLV